MIKVEYCIDRNLIEWYWSKINKKILQSIGKLDNNTEWKEILSDKNVIKDILFKPLSFLLEKYSWIQEYYNNHMKTSVEYESDMIFNECFKWQFLKDMKGELVKRMGVKICPYCNQNYVYSVELEDNKVKYLGDIDHFLPRSKFKLFCLSLWNLIPSCKSCNQTFKHNNWSKMLSPVEGGFEDDCVFHIEFGNVESMLGVSDDFSVRWKLCRNGYNNKRIEKIEENISVLKLNELYSDHKEEIKRILKTKALLLNESYQNSLPGFHYNNPFMCIFGDYISEKNYVILPHSKMIHDILFFN